MLHMLRTLASFLLLTSVTPLLASDAAMSKLKVALTAVQALTAQKLDYSIPENSAQLKAAVERFFSPELLSQRALGRGWRQLNPEQRTTFVKNFTDLLIANYASQLQESGDADVLYGESRTMGSGRVEISTSIVNGASELEVLYRMTDHENDWQVYDVIIEGVSLVSNYRSQFTSILQRHGPDGLLQKLQEQLDNR